MKIAFLLIILVNANHSLFAQSKNDSSQEYLLIVRYKTAMKTPDADMLKSISQHWGTFISELAQSGKLVNGFRPATEGRTITGSAKTSTNEPYIKDGEEISSIFLIKAANIDEASTIARKCPIYEMDGSVEIRPLSFTK
jgi:hypothetical protein